MSNSTNNSMDELITLVRASSRGVPPASLLHISPQELLGVSLAAFTALTTLEINTIFDLATSQAFAAATQLVAAANDRSSPIFQFGSPPSDLVRASQIVGKSLQEIPFAPIIALQSIPEASAATIATALDVVTVRDLSLYPPYRAAVKILNALYFPNISTAYDPERPADLVPKSGEYPIEKVQYSTLLLGDIKTDEVALIDVNGPKFVPLDLGKLSAQNAGFKTVAFGGLLTFTQSWFAQGVTLGHLLHSITLAPGESTRVAVVDWSRKSKAGETEVISEQDTLSSDASHNRSISEVTNAVANEAQTGFSETTNASRSTQSGTSVAGEISAPLGGLFGGPSASFGTTSSEATAQGQSDSYSTTSGSRQVSSAMLQNINDRTHQNAHDSRNRRASVIKEVSQSEHEEVSTRVLVNYNHMHALSVQYYEVVQVFRVEVKLSKVDKVVFIPVQLPDLNDNSVIRRFQSPLFRAALTLGVRDALQSLDAVEVAPEPATRFSVFSVPLQQFLTASLLTRTSLTASSLRATVSEFVKPPVPSTTAPTASPSVAPPADAASSTASITPHDLAISSTSTSQFVTLSDALSVVHQVNHHLWSTDQVARLSGILNTSLLRSDSNSLFLPGDVLIEGGITSSSGGTPFSIVFHMHQGGTVTDVSPDNPVAITDTTSIALSGSHPTLDISATVTLTANRNGIRFPVQLPAVMIPKTTTTETTIVRIKPGGVNANLKQHLSANSMYYCQAILRSLDSTQIALLLSGYGVYLGKQFVPVAQIVEPKPIRYVANFLAFKTNAAGDDEVWGKWLKDHGIVPNSSIEDIVPLGSGGVFAEAILGRSNCAEKLDITRFWNWQDSPIPLQPSDIAAIQTGSRATAEDVKPGQLSNPIINITAPTLLPAPTGTADILAAIQNGNLFRDQSGLAATIGLTQAALQATSAGAATAGQQAGTNMNALLQANTERQKTAASMITELAKTAASMYSARLAATKSDGGSGGGGGGSNHSQDGAKINYFDKTQGQSSDVSGNSSGSSGGKVTAAPGGDQSGGGTMITSGGRNNGYSQNPAILASTWGPTQPATDLLDQVTQHIGSVLGDSSSNAPLTTRKAWPRLDETQVLSRIDDLQHNANLFQQGIIGLCTAAAFFHHIIQKDSTRFAKFAKELYGAGLSYIGQMKVAPGSDLRNVDYNALATQFGTMPPQADWMLMCSIRDSENWVFDFEGSPDEDVAIGTSAKELSEWYKNTGLYSKVAFSEDIDTIAKIKAITKTANNHIALWITVNLIQPDTHKNTHIITLEGPITIDEAMDKVTFEYWTWAQPVKKLETKFSTFKDCLLGYIIAAF